jgi:hypothetical protein
MLVAWAATLACVWMLFRLGVLAAGGLGPLAPLVLVTTFVVCMGLVSALRLSVAVAFLESRSGTGSMARSAALTRGRRLRIVLAELVLGVLLSPLSGLLRGLEPGTTRYLIAEIGTQAVILTVHACFAAVVYAQLRQRRDGATAAVVVASLGR